MFDFLSGKVVIKKIESVTLEIQGVGYKLLIPLSLHGSIEVGSEYRFFLYEHIREDQFQFYGFLEEQQRDLFTILVNANGVGPKIALAIISTFSVEELISVVQMADISKLTTVPGLGEKKAQKLYLDIKDKIRQIKGSHLGASLEIASNSKFSYEDDLYLALESLGYKSVEISKVLKKMKLEEYPTIEEAIRFVLKEI